MNKKLQPSDLIENLDLVKKELKRWVQSGEYYQEILEKIDIAYTIVKKFIGQKNKIVVLDIDETMISEFDLMLKYDFGWSDQALEEAQVFEHFPSFKCVVEFVDYCANNKLDVYVLSSRRRKYAQYVLPLLDNAGYKNYKLLILRPDEDKGTIQDFKISERKKLYESNLEIIVNIGDQPSDLDGGYALNVIKIPNPFYLIDSTI